MISPFTVFAFDEVYYVRDDDGGPYGNQSGVGWANAFAGMAAVSYGTGAGQVGPGDLLCIDGDVVSSANVTVTQGGTSTLVPFTISGSGFASCNDGSDSGTGKVRLDIAGSGAVMNIRGDFTTVRDLTVQGAGASTPSVGADGLSVGIRGRLRTFDRYG